MMNVCDDSSSMLSKEEEKTFNIFQDCLYFLPHKILAIHQLLLVLEIFFLQSNNFAFQQLRLKGNSGS